MIQIVTQDDPPTTPRRYVIATGPFPEGTTSADFGDGYTLLEVDDSQLTVLENNLYSYLDTDGVTLYGGPEPTS